MTSNGENLSPGELLLAARQKTELSLEQLAENTKIPLNMLRAIEMDEYHKVSGDLYVKSFLRSYAKEVGLEPEEMIDAYQSFTGAVTDAQQTGTDGAWDESDVQVKRVGLPWGLIATIVLILIVAASAYYWFVVKGASDSPGENESIESPVQDPGQSANQVEDPPDDLASVENSEEANSPAQYIQPDTLALGWQMESPTDLESSPPGTGKVHRPTAFAGTDEVVFEGGKKWPYVVRLICEQPGDFSTKKDAETSFTEVEFPSSLASCEFLPSENLVAGRAYSARQGFVVYWGAADHLSLRLGQILGIELSFNGQAQDLSRFHPGQEILLDSSLLNDGVGN